MNSLIDTLNLWGEHLLGFCVPLLLQSSLLIAVLYGFDLAFRRRIRAVIRYALWLVVLVKLVLPPSLALPTGLAWWLHPRNAPPAKPQPSFVVTYGNATLPMLPRAVVPAYTPPPPRLSAEGWMFVAWAGVGLALLSWMGVRWLSVARDIRRATPGESWLVELLATTRSEAGLRREVRLRLTNRPMSPAVCGLIRPVILLPHALVAQLPPAQLRAVLLHELVHLRRGDVWVNCLQALLQIVYWWHPLVWLANARIRRVREEAVDDAVMLALRDDAEHYAPTLLEVAKLAFRRPLASLGLVGILESRSALRQRIERLVNFQSPRRAGLSMGAVLGIAAFAAVAVPMGQAPARTNVPASEWNVQTSPFPDPRFRDYKLLHLDAEFLIADSASIRSLLPRLLDSAKPLALSSDETTTMREKLRLANARLFCEAEPLRFQTFSGGRFCWRIGGGITNNGVNYTTRPFGGRLIVTGANIGFAADPPDWTPLIFNAEPLWDDGAIRFKAELASARHADSPRCATLTVPTNGALVWALAEGMAPGMCEIVFLRSSARSNATTAVGAESPDSGVESGTRRARTNLVAAGDGRRRIINKLDQIRIDRVACETLPLVKVIGNLFEEAKRHDPDQQGINFIIQPSAFASFSSSSWSAHELDAGLPEADLMNLPITINPPLTNVRLADVLDAVVKASPKPIRYSIESYAVVFSLRGQEVQPLTTLAFRFDGDALDAEIRKRTGLPETADESQLTEGLLTVFASLGADFRPPKTLFRSGLKQKVQRLLVRATPIELETIQAFIVGLAPPPARALADRPRTTSRPVERGDVVEAEVQAEHALKSPAQEAARLVQDGKLLWELGKLDEAEAKLNQAMKLSPANRAAAYYLDLVKDTRNRQGAPRREEVPYPRTNLVFSGKGRQTIINKLNRIVFQQTQTYDGLSLGEVVRSLNAESKQRDPDQRGINFIVNPTTVTASPSAQSPTVAPDSGRPTEADSSDRRAEVSSVTIKLPALTGVTLADLLDAIVKAAEQPIKYSIEEYAVVFSLRGQETQPLTTRVFKLDPNTFYQGLESVGAGGGKRFNNQTNGMAAVATGLLDYFLRLGVDLTPPKTLFWNDRAGKLIVRATVEDLDVIQTAIQFLNEAPPQINIQSEFIEMSEAAYRGFCASIIQSNGPAVGYSMATFTGILSSERARNVLKELEAKDGVELMSVPEVTTLSERQAQVQAVDIRTILTGINPKALSAPGVESADGTNGIYLSQSAPFGATLDILPSVTPDGFAIELTVSPAVTEFLGYDPSTQKTPVYVKGKQTDGLRPLPRHRVRQAAAHATVWDGQTLVIGGISPVEVFTKPDGETATEPSQDSTLKHLVVLVTPTIVDHAGNRLHPD